MEEYPLNSLSEQIVEQQGSSGYKQQQHIDDDSVIVSQNEREDAQLEVDIGWLVDAFEEEDPSFFENHISGGHDDMILTGIHLEEDDTDHNGSASEGAAGELLEQNTSSSSLMSQQPHLSSPESR